MAGRPPNNSHVGRASPDVARALGRLEADAENAAKSRKLIHERLDKQQEMIMATSNNIDAVVKMAAKTERDLFEFKKEFTVNALPLLRGVKVIRNVAVGTLAFLLGSTAMVAYAVSQANEMAVAAVRVWLGIT